MTDSVCRSGGGGGEFHKDREKEDCILHTKNRGHTVCASLPPEKDL